MQLVVFLTGFLSCLAHTFQTSQNLRSTLSYHEQEQACSHQNPIIRNGGFENRKQEPWKISKSLDAAGEFGISKGDDSPSAGQLRFITTGHNGGEIYFYQDIQLCKDVEYRFGWSMYDVPQSTDYIDHAPDMFVEIKDADGGTLDFYSFYLNRKNFTESQNTYRLGHWYKFAYKYSYTARKSGIAQFRFLVLTVSESYGNGTIRFDDVYLEVAKSRR